MSQPNWKDIYWITLVATMVLTFSSIPNWVGYRTQTEELNYKGIFFDPQDYAVHMSMLRAGMQGDWAYQFRYTTESHQRAYTRLFYLGLGQTNRFFQLNPSVLFEIARWFFGYIALFTIYALTKRTFKEIFWQRVAFLLAVFGSGIGWLQLIFGWLPGPITPIDFWLIDAYVFFGVALFPHFAFVTAALCSVFLLFLDYLEKGGWKRIAGIVTISVLTQFINPIAFVLVDLALAIAAFTIWLKERKINWEQFAALAVIALVQLPPLIYNYNLLNNDPIWSQFTRQNETLSPQPIYYLLGFGLFWLFSLVGLISAILQRKPALLGAAAWIVTGLVLAYVPFAIQRRFLHGITIPLALLSAQGLIHLIHFLSQKTPSLTPRFASIPLIVVFFISLSNIYLSLGRSIYLLGQPDEFFYPASLNPALVWLEENATANDFVLSAMPSGQLITQKTNMRVYLGHPMETLDFDDKTRFVQTYFQGRSDSDWLEQSKVHWVFFGPYERALAGEAVFQDAGLKVAYRSAEITIYRVDP